MVDNEGKAQEGIADKVNENKDTDEGKDNDMSNLEKWANPSYSTKEFWNERFEKTAGNFDWYVDWKQLKEHYEKFINPNLSFLMVGCGNSKMSEQMYSDKYENITNIDISDVVINQMSINLKDQCPNMKFQVMDATKMSFLTNSFDCVIDKGTLDALMCASDKNIPQCLIKEMFRVTKWNGYCTIITHGEPKKRIDYISDIINYDENEYTFEISSSKITLSFMSNFINSVRNSSSDHSIKTGMNNKSIVIASWLDAFVNSYDKDKLTEDQKKAKKKAELYIRVQKMLNKFGNDKEKIKKFKEGTLEDENSEDKNNDSKKKESIRQTNCYLYIIKKLAKKKQ